jgi:hypothetical protein
MQHEQKHSILLSALQPDPAETFAEFAADLKLSDAERVEIEGHVREWMSSNANKLVKAASGGWSQFWPHHEQLRSALHDAREPRPAYAIFYLIEKCRELGYVVPLISSEAVGEDLDMYWPYVSSKAPLPDLLVIDSSKPELYPPADLFFYPMLVPYSPESAKRNLQVNVDSEEISWMAGTNATTHYKIMKDGHIGSGTFGTVIRYVQLSKIMVTSQTFADEDSIFCRCINFEGQPVVIKQQILVGLPAMILDRLISGERVGEFLPGHIGLAQHASTFTNGSLFVRILKHDDALIARLLISSAADGV